MHFAAQSHVDNSFGNSFDFTVTNILGTHVLLEAAKEFKHQIKLFIHVSTDEVYGDGESGLASHESTILDPTNPYAASKAGAEYLVKAYHRSFAVPTIITRSNNVYGPHQYPEKIIPKFITQLTRGLPITLHGNGLNTRNYLYVADVVSAFDLVFRKGVVGQVYNIGGTHEVSNIDVARVLMRLLGKTHGDAQTLHTPEHSSFIRANDSSTAKPAPSSSDGCPQLSAEEEALVCWVPDRPFNDLRYALNSDKIQALGWTERVSWDDGLRKTVEWYKENLGNWRVQDVDGALQAHPRRGINL